MDHQEFWDKHQETLDMEHKKWTQLHTLLISMLKDASYPQDQYVALEGMMRLCSGHLGWLQAKQIELDEARNAEKIPDQVRDYFRR